MATRWLKKGICAVLGLTALLALAASAGATTICNGSPTSPIDDNVLVPSGATCTLNNVTVTGNVTVESGGCLIAGESAGGAIIGGNVSATAAECLTIGPGTSIGGSVTALSTAGGENYICKTTIGGNVTIDNSRADATWCIGPPPSNNKGSACKQCPQNTINTIIGNLTFDNNKGLSEIDNNYIGSNLNCSGNNNKNLIGSGNQATNKLGQCAGF